MRLRARTETISFRASTFVRNDLPVASVFRTVPLRRFSGQPAMVWSVGGREMGTVTLSTRAIRFLHRRKTLFGDHGHA
jgi:hypothetical protein